MPEDNQEIANWEKAKLKLNIIQEPEVTSTFQIKGKSCYLSPIMGYEVKLHYDKNKFLVMFNNFLLRAYVRDFGSTEIDYKTAKKIFNS